MSTTLNRIYIAILSLIVLLTAISIGYYGFSYYRLPVEERFFNDSHNLLKPSGAIGHGLGIIGTLLIIMGVLLYMARKRLRSWSRMGRLKYWLEFHIFLCTLGPMLVLYHTAMKFGGIVSVSFWSMVAVFLSGIIGRFIYIQIPRTIEGRELTLNEVRNQKQDIGEILKNDYTLDDESLNHIIDFTSTKVEKYHKNFLVRILIKYRNDRYAIKNVKSVLKKNKFTNVQKREVMKLIGGEISINRKIERLNTMQNLFKYWHVAHLPFAFVMLIIMIIHVIVTITFGYRWIF
ncbi:MAG: hypothetical protein Q8O72_07500 [Bacteroidales bacterium]|nr:hypothetical protein [Bacteroidales bacterium]